MDDLAGRASEREIAFEPGWSARFVPDLELIDPAGKVAAGDGTRISGFCPTAEPGVERVELDIPG